MATKGQTLHTEPTDLHQQHWGVVTSLYWSGFLVLLLAFWVGYYAAETSTWACWVVGVVAFGYLGLALWQNLTLRNLKGQEDAEVKQVLLAQRRLVSFGLFGLVSLLMLTMLILGWSEGFTPSFAPFLSAVLFGIFSAAQGLWLMSPPGGPPIQDVVLENLFALRFVVMVASFVLAVVFFLGSVWFWGWFLATPVPEFLGALGLFAVFLGAGTWLFLNMSSPELNLNRFRMFVLLVGGAAGLVLFTAVYFRFYAWGTELLTGGLSAWRYNPTATSRAVQIWACAYAGIFSLALMFGSLYLAHADIRQNPMLRRLIYGYNAVFNGLMLLAILIVLNTVIYGTFPYTFNWTEAQGFYSLSQRSKNMLRSLNKKKPITVYVLMSSKNRDYADVKTLLGNCQAYTSKLRVKYISPEQDKLAYRDLQAQFKSLKSSNGRGLLVAYGSVTDNKTPLHSFIEADQLSSVSGMMRRDSSDRTSHEFKGEALLMTQIDLLTNEKQKPVVYFTFGFGECSASGPQGRPAFWGAKSLADKLKANNYVVKTLYWGVRPRGIKNIPESWVFSKKSIKAPHVIPPDASVLTVVWPKTAYSKEVLGAVGDYLNRPVVKKPDGTMTKGKLVLLSSILNHRDLSAGDLGWRKFLKDYGVDFHQNCLFRYPPVRGWQFVISEPVDKSSKLAKEFQGSLFLLYFPRTVAPLAGDKSGYKVETFLEARRDAQSVILSEANPSKIELGEAYVNQLRGNRDLVRQMVVAKPSVAVTVKDPEDNPRMVVFGEAMQLATDEADFRTNDPYLDLVASSFSWLADRPGTIGIPPKKSNYYKMKGNVSAVRMIFLPFGLLTLGLFGIGVGVWVVRRR